MAKGISTGPWCGSIAAKLEKNIRFLIETTLRENLPLLLPRPFTFANGVKTGVHSPPHSGSFSTLWYHDLSLIAPQKVSNCAF